MTPKQQKAIDAIKAFRARVAKTDEMLEGVALKVSLEVRKLIDEGFQEGRDPDGDKWAERKKDYPHPILDRTGKMRRGYKVRSRKSQITITNSEKQFKYHQSGTENMEARKTVPDGELSPKWKKRMTEAAHISMKKHYYGK